MIREASIVAALLVAAAGVAAGDDGAAARPQQNDAEPEARAEDDGGVYERAVVEVKPGDKPIDALTVNNELGDIKIYGHDEEGVVIHAYKHGPDHAALDQLRIALVPDPDGPVRITTAVKRAAEKTTLPTDQVRIDLEIWAPRAARVDARVGRGELVVRNMDAGGDLDAGAGAITVENVSGAVYARSVDGDQSFEEVFGNLDVQALAADLQFDTVRGDALYASVNDGTIEARRVASKKVELRTTRGRIHLESELALGGKLLVASRHGDVDVRVKAAGALKVKALGGGAVNLVGAEAVSNKDAEWVRARYGKGKRAAAVELRSKFADIRFEVIE